MALGFYLGLFLPKNHQNKKNLEKSLQESKVIVSLIYQKQNNMKKYIVISDEKNPGMDTNTLESFIVMASSLKEAEKIGRRQCRRDGVKFVSVKLKK